MSGNPQFTSTFGYNPWMGLTNVNGPNGSASTTSYDIYSRPFDSLAPTGAVTKYFYYPDPSPNTAYFPTARYFSGSSAGQIAVTGFPDPSTSAFTPVHWSRNTLDGLGRTIKMESGAAPDYTTRSPWWTPYTGRAGARPRVK